MSDIDRRRRTVTEYDNYPIPPYDASLSEEERIRLKENAKKKLADLIDQVSKDNI